MKCVERTVKLATQVTTLPDAWAFIMSHIDELGDNPAIAISPMWVFGEDHEPSTRLFEVVVSGMVPQYTEES